MTTMKESEIERITRQLKDTLNKNGYSFQYSVIKELVKTTEEWKLYGSEIPVSSRGKNTHADLVFQSAHSYFYLVGECKRVQPGFADWVFVKTPFNSRKDENYPHLVIDHLQERRGNEDTPEVKKTIDYYSRAITPDVYGLGFRVKKHLKENEVECQDSADVINKTIEQVLKSTSGFINLLSHIVRADNMINYTDDYYFLPVIFTSANLFVSDDDIAEADLATGNLPELATVKEVPYLWFNYNRPRELSPEFKNFTFYYNQPYALQTQAPRDSVMKEAKNYGEYGFEYEDFTRSVLIVNSSHLGIIDRFNKSYFNL